MILILFIILGVLTISFVGSFFGKKSKSDSPGTPPQVPPAPDESPEPLLIHCPACGTEISRYAPSCLKCGHPICPATNPKTASLSDHNQTIIIQQPTRQSNGVGTAGFVLALISLFSLWVPGVSWVAWFLGFLLSFIGMFKSPRGLAIAGFIISIIDLIILLAFVSALAGIASHFL